MHYFGFNFLMRDYHKFGLELFRHDVKKDCSFEGSKGDSFVVTALRRFNQSLLLNMHQNSNKYVVSCVLAALSRYSKTVVPTNPRCFEMTRAGSPPVKLGTRVSSILEAV